MQRIVRLIVAMAVAGLLALTALVPSVAADSTSRPFKGSSAGVADVAPDATCATGLRTIVTHAGVATHVGLLSMTGSHCSPDWGAPLLGGEFTLVAANGDTIVGTYTGTIEPFEPAEGAIMVGEIDNVITGGTGRFAGATGGFVIAMRGVLHFTSPMTVTQTWDGTISY
jgi:hypothetical protein